MSSPGREKGTAPWSMFKGWETARVSCFRATVQLALAGAKWSKWREWGWEGKSGLDCVVPWVPWEAEAFSGKRHDPSKTLETLLTTQNKAKTEEIDKTWSLTIYEVSADDLAQKSSDRSSLVSAPTIYKPTHTGPIFFLIPFTKEEVSLLLANITSLSTCSGSHRLILRPCLPSLFLSIGLFPQHIPVISGKPSLHSIPSTSWSLYSKFFQGQIPLESHLLCSIHPLVYSSITSALDTSVVLPVAQWCWIQWHFRYLYLPQLVAAA